MKEEITFKDLSVGFMNLVTERFPTSDKVIKEATKLVGNEPVAQMIIITQWRDAIGEVAPAQLFGRPGKEKLEDVINQRNTLRDAVIEALEQLEDEIEELEIDMGEDMFEEEIPPEPEEDDTSKKTPKASKG